MLQAMLSGLNKPQPSWGLQGGSHGAHAQPRDNPIEPGLIGAPRRLQAWPTLYGVESTTNNDKHSHVSIYCEHQPVSIYCEHQPVSARSPHRVAHRSRDFRRQRSQRDSLCRYEERSGRRAHHAVVPLKLLPNCQSGHLWTRNRQDSHLHWSSILASPRRLLVPA